MNKSSAATRRAAQAWPQRNLSGCQCPHEQDLAEKTSYTPLCSLWQQKEARIDLRTYIHPPKTLRFCILDWKYCVKPADWFSICLEKSSRFQNRSETLSMTWRKYEKKYWKRPKVLSDPGVEEFSGVRCENFWWITCVFDKILGSD